MFKFEIKNDSIGELVFQKRTPVEESRTGILYVGLGALIISMIRYIRGYNDGSNFIVPVSGSIAASKHTSSTSKSIEVKDLKYV
jgi:hypothetical protein